MVSFSNYENYEDLENAPLNDQQCMTAILKDTKGSERGELYSKIINHEVCNPDSKKEIENEEYDCLVSSLGTKSGTLRGVAFKSAHSSGICKELIDNSNNNNSSNKEPCPEGEIADPTTGECVKVEDFQVSEEEEKPDSKIELFNLRLLLKSLLYGCLFYIISHPLTYKNIIEKILGKVSGESVNISKMFLFIICLYIITLFV